LKESGSQPAAPTWEDAHSKGVPTWDDAHPSEAKQKEARSQPAAPTWDDAHPTTAKQIGAEANKVIVCKALDNSVTEHWCRTTCSTGTHCPKVCVCGPSDDLIKSHKLSWADYRKSQRAKLSALSAVRQEEGAEGKPMVKCKSLSPSVMDYWCDTQCADGSKCPKNVCNCDGGLQLRESDPQPTGPTWDDAHPVAAKQKAAPTWEDAHPSSLVKPGESAVRQEEDSEEKPKVKCKSLRAGVLDYWCDTQCADESKCPKHVCNCDGNVQLRETTKRGQPAAPTWEDAHPSKAKSEGADAKNEIVCKTLDNSVTEHWCQTTCLAGSHCPKVCACGDLLRPSDDGQGQTK